MLVAAGIVLMALIGKGDAYVTGMLPPVVPLGLDLVGMVRR